MALLQSWNKKLKLHNTPVFLGRKQIPGVLLEQAAEEQRGRI